MSWLDADFSEEGVSSESMSKMWAGPYKGATIDENGYLHYGGNNSTSGYRILIPIVAVILGLIIIILSCSYEYVLGAENPTSPTFGKQTAAKVGLGIAGIGTLISLGNLGYSTSFLWVMAISAIIIGIMIIISLYYYETNMTKSEGTSLSDVFGSLGSYKQYGYYIGGGLIGIGLLAIMIKLMYIGRRYGRIYNTKQAWRKMDDDEKKNYYMSQAPYGDYGDPMDYLTSEEHRKYSSGPKGYFTSEESSNYAAA